MCEPWSEVQAVSWNHSLFTMSQPRSHTSVCCWQHFGSKSQLVKLGVTMAVRAELEFFASVTKVLTKTQVNDLRLLAEVGKSLLRAEALEMLDNFPISPCLLQYSADCTPVRTRSHYGAGKGLTSLIHASVATTQEYLVQLCFLTVLCGDTVRQKIVFRDPICLQHQPWLDVPRSSYHRSGCRAERALSSFIRSMTEACHGGLGRRSLASFVTLHCRSKQEQGAAQTGRLSCKCILSVVVPCTTPTTMSSVLHNHKKPGF